MYRVFPNMKFIQMVVITLVVTTFVISCKEEIVEEPLDLTTIPLQTVENMNALQTRNGLLQMRMEAPLLQRFENDKESYELFPNGFFVYAYNEEGMLETQIESNVARHTVAAKGKEETWEAYGNVVLTNCIKGERMETDTLYWDREQGKIYTRCLVKMYAPGGFMQGYGMESDEMARNAKIGRPFDSYGIVGRDSTTAVYIDTVNFIGPLAKPGF